MKKIVSILMLSVISVFAFEKLTIENFDSKLKDKNVIVDFYADWCPPCHILAHNLEDFDIIKPDNVTVYKVNVDDQMELTQKFQVRSLPTLIFFKNGKILKSNVGIISAEQLVKDSKSIFK